MNAQEVGNKKLNSEEIIREHLEETPFTCIKKTDSGYFAVMGQYRLTDEFESKEELEEYVYKNNNWELMMNVVSIMVETINNNK